MGIRIRIGERRMRNMTTGRKREVRRGEEERVRNSHITLLLLVVLVLVLVVVVKLPLLLSRLLSVSEYYNTLKRNSTRKRRMLLSPTRFARVCIRYFPWYF